MQKTVPQRNLSGVTESDASPEVAALYARFRENFGRPVVPGILQCFATHPPLLEHMMALAASMLFAEGSLGRRNKELIATFISARNQCSYCADSHGYAFRLQGGSAEQLAAAMACDLQAEVLGAQETALLRFVDKVTEQAESMRRSDVDLLLAAGWTELQVTETVHLTALFACFNRVVSAFGLPSQELLAMFDQDENAHPRSSATKQSALPDHDVPAVQENGA